MSQFDNIKSYATAREEANIEWEVGLEDLLDKEIVILETTPDSKVLPQTKQRTQGYTVKGAYIATDEDFKVFVGATRLVQELTALAVPFKTVIRRSGQTYRFS